MKKNEQVHTKTVNISTLMSKISALEKTNSSLLNEIQALKEELTTYQRKASKEELLIDKINSLKNENLALKTKFSNLQREYESYKLVISNQFDRQVSLVRSQNENNYHKIENMNKLEKINTTLFYKILELENIIKHFAEEEKKKIAKINLDHQNKIEEFKLKMINFMKDEYMKSSTGSSKSELNKNLTLLHINQLVDELSFQSKHIEELIKEKEILNRKIHDLKSDLEIHLKVEALLGEKNKMFQEQLLKKTKQIKVCDSKPLLTDRNRTYSNALSPYNDKSNIKNNSNNNAINKRILLTKALINKSKEKEQFKLKYETERDKLTLLKKKYITLFDMIDKALNNSFNNIKQKCDVLSKEQIDNCEFNNLSQEQQQEVLLVIMSNVLEFLQDNLVGCDPLPSQMKTHYKGLEIQSDNFNSSSSKITDNTSHSNFYKSSYTNGRSFKDSDLMLMSSSDLMKYRKHRVNSLKMFYRKHNFVYSQRNNTSTLGNINTNHHERANSFKGMNEIGYTHKKNRCILKDTQVRLMNFSVLNGLNN